jgi:predicted DNA-binding transcriptional regulator YafY
MTKTTDQLYRQWELLQKIPVRPASKTASQLAQELKDDGFVVSKRTVERDLNDLKLGPFAVSSDEKGLGNNPNRWFFERDARLHLLPAMTTQMAFTLLLARKLLGPMLPPSVLEPMSPILEKAETTLGHKGFSSTYRQWEKHVKHVPRTLPLQPAAINPGVLELCLDGTLKGERLSIAYQPRYEAETQYETNPLGLIYRDGVTYLVCTLWEYSDIKQLALHRMQSVEPMTDIKARRLPGFDLDAYVAQEGAFLYPRQGGKAFQVELKFDADTAQHLVETPISADQTISCQGDYCIVRAAVLDTEQLRWWLLGFGEYVEVLKPKKLRDEFASIAARMARLYT